MPVSRFILLSLVLPLAACQTAVVSIGPVDLPAPVLVGPVLTLGGQAAGPPAAGAAFSASAIAVPVEPQRPTGNELPDRNFTERLGVRSDLPQQLVQALGGQPGRALFVNRVRVVDTVHWTALFWLDKRLLVEGYSFSAAAAADRGGR